MREEKEVFQVLMNKKRINFGKNPTNLFMPNIILISEKNDNVQQPFCYNIYIPLCLLPHRDVFMIYGCTVQESGKSFQAIAIPLRVTLWRLYVPTYNVVKGPKLQEKALITVSQSPRPSKAQSKPCVAYVALLIPYITLMAREPWNNKVLN